MLKPRASIIAITLLFSAFAIAQSPPAKRGLLPTDLSALRDVGDAQISPDGARVVYVVSETAPDRTRALSRLWIVPTAGGESKRLTLGEANESTPRWSPDGRRIAFYSNRDGRDGLWVVPAEGGEPALASHVFRTNFFLTKAGESFSWSPDGKQIAFLSSIEVLSDRPVAAVGNAPPGLPAAATRPLSREDIEKLPVEVREMLFRAQGQAMGLRPQSPIENALSPLPDDPRVITRLQYKSRTSFSDTLQSHIFAVDLASREVRQITTGLAYEHSIHWSPKGDEIVFVSNREPDPDKVNNTDLFVVNVKTFDIRQLTKTKGCEWQPVFSPDGSQIAYLATRRMITTIDSVAEDSHAYLISAEGGEGKDITHGLDMRVSAVKWWRDGKSVVYAAGNKGRTVLFLADKSDVSVFLERGFGADSQITSFSIGNGNAIVYTASDATHPVELFAQSAEFSQAEKNVSLGKAVPLTQANGAIREALLFSPMESFRFKSDEFEVEGWLVQPLDRSAMLQNLKNLEESLKERQKTYGAEHPAIVEVNKQIEELKALTASRRYPVILNIHGGPHGMHGYSFNPAVQALAAQGYAVLLINPRGSSGYGQKFADGCVNDWGGGDYRDLMSGVDEALARWPFLDKNRLGVMGGSYGGYMTNWVVTQTPRFRGAVASASLSNLISFYATSLYQDLVHAEFNGFPWNNFDQLWTRSPLKYIASVKTPLLLIHGEQDNDVHITQAEEMYTAVRMQGVEAALVRYPREGHGLREPRHREDSLARTLLWFDRHVKP
jgi:dipeptidyl aminopeptidase/acylaminoacyl peptidase